MAKDNLTVSANIQTTAREVDFVTRFAKNWQSLRDIMGIMRVVRKEPGTILKSKYATVVLQSGDVGEGENIPYSAATVKEKDYAKIKVEKYAKGVSIEAINEHGYNDAINMTDKEFLAELQNNVTERFYDYLNTGTLVLTAGTFQEALAMAQGNVRNKWKQMHRGITEIIGFCNILDAYAYLGAANITVQSEFGMNYIENFLGYRKLFLLSDGECPKGRVIATPVENIVLYHVNPNDSDFAKAGLRYTTDGETNLIGFHVDGDYHTATSETFALMGLTLFAEYIDGIAVVSINSTLITDAKVGAELQASSVYEVPVSDIQSADLAFNESGKVTGTSKYLKGTNPITAYWGEGNFLAFKVSDIPATAVSVKVGLIPSEGTGMVEIINDPDKNGIFKIADKSQKFAIVTSDGENTHTKYYDLSSVVLEADEA